MSPSPSHGFEPERGVQNYSRVNRGLRALPSTTMANPKRPAKPGRNWTFNELDAYNIRINTVDTQAFFGIPDLPAPVVDPVILNYVNAPLDEELPWNINVFFDYLHVAAPNDEAYVLEFSCHLLSHILRFNTPHRIMHQRPNFSFLMSGYRVKAVPDISIRDKREEYHILLAHTDKVSFPLLPYGYASLTPTKLSRNRAEPRLVASALGAFSSDNFHRTAVGLPPMPSKRYIGIVMIGTAPRFYKITVTRALVDAVMASQIPEETIIQRFVPPVPDADNFLQDGMVPLDKRRVCFQCFEALKTLL